MSLSTNTTYRVFVEKLGGTDPANFVGDAGEVFLDPSVPELKLSDGATAGGLTIGGGSGGESYWVSTAAGIHTLSNVGVGTTNPKVRLQIDGVLGFGTFTGAYGTSTNIRIGDETTGSDLTTGSNNIFMGVGAGKSTTSAVFDNFIGYESGKNNTTGASNNFFGSYSGTNNTDGGYNSFFGNLSGVSNTTGSLNAFAGASSGQNNTSGSYNSFFGDECGYRNTIGNYNSFFGEAAGFRNTTGSNNIFLGAFTGISTSSSAKVLIGFGNNFSNYFDYWDTTKDTQLAIGIRTSSAASKYWLVGDENFNIGINSTAPTAKLDVGGDVKVGINTSQGVILTDSNGVAWRLIVNTDGTLATAAV